MSKAVASAAERRPASLSERFFSIARVRGGTGVEGDSVDPVMVTRHVLSILDALDRGEGAGPVSVRTISFLKLLRESEQRGDLSYAAPEQITGEMLDERSLVFSVGVLLFERLTGRHPFGAEGNNVRRVARIRKGEFGSGVNYFPTVPVGLRTILMKAMGPFPEERWSTLKELRSHLEQFVEQEQPRGVHLPGTTPAEPPARQTTRGPRSDRESTRVVDMSSQIRSELVRVSEQRRRDRRQVAGEIEPAPVTPIPLRVDPPTASAVIVKPDAPPAMRSLPTAPPPTPAPRPRPAPVDEASILPELAREDYVPNLRPRAPHGTKPLLWLGLGAAIASVAFFVLSGGGTKTPSAAVGAVAAPSASDDRSEPEAATEPTAETAATEAATPTAAAAPAPAVFDAEIAGADAVEYVRSCLAPDAVERGVSFGIGLLIDHDTGRVKKTYFSGDADLPWPVRKCMKEKLEGRSVTPTPPTSEILDYYARVKGSQVSVKVKVK